LASARREAVEDNPRRKVKKRKKNEKGVVFGGATLIVVVSCFCWFASPSLSPSDLHEAN